MAQKSAAMFVPLLSQNNCQHHSRLYDGHTGTVTAVHVRPEMLVFAVSLHDGMKCSSISQCKCILAS